jgi:hypothetical protein
MYDYPSRRRPGPRWPHFDSRGPDHYFDPERPHALEPIADREWYDDRRYPPLYEDEYRHRYDDRFEDRDQDHWPEDEFFVHRRELPGEGRFYGHAGAEPRRERWKPFRHHREGFPEDRHPHEYGRDNFAYNGNRDGDPRRSRY